MLVKPNGMQDEEVAAGSGGQVDGQARNRDQWAISVSI
jgi:hypothetical protein